MKLSLTLSEDLLNRSVFFDSISFIKDSMSVFSLESFSFLSKSFVYSSSTFSYRSKARMLTSPMFANILSNDMISDFSSISDFFLFIFTSLDCSKAWWSAAIWALIDAFSIEILFIFTSNSLLDSAFVDIVFSCFCTRSDIFWRLLNNDLNCW